MEKLGTKPATVPEQIAEVMKARGDAVALTQGGRSMTYEELNRRAKSYADSFSSSGIGPGGTVAICLERSFDGIAAALAAMRVGAAYVPLDLTWPVARLR